MLSKVARFCLCRRRAVRVRVFRKMISRSDRLFSLVSLCRDATVAVGTCSNAMFVCQTCHDSCPCLCTNPCLFLSCPCQSLCPFICLFLLLFRSSKMSNRLCVCPCRSVCPKLFPCFCLFPFALGALPSASCCCCSCCCCCC